MPKCLQRIPVDLSAANVKLQQPEQIPYFHILLTSELFILKEYHRQQSKPFINKSENT